MEAYLTFLPLHSNVTMTTETPQTPQYGDNTNYLATDAYYKTFSLFSQPPETSTSSQLP